MYSQDKMKCLECGFNNSCPSYTRVFVNYCGSMSGPLKDLIFRARMDCRIRRRNFKYGMLQHAGNTCLVKSGEELLESQYSI